MKAVIMLCCMFGLTTVAAQEEFTLERESDSLYVVRLGNDGWTLPFPVYQFQIADVDGDGSTDAIVGVTKTTL